MKQPPDPASGDLRHLPDHETVRGTLSRDSTVNCLLDTKGALTTDDAPTLTADGTESSNNSDITRCGSRAAERETLGSRLETLPLTLLDRLRRATAAEETSAAAERLRDESPGCNWKLF